MPIQWNGLDSGLKPGFADLINQTIGGLPFTYSVQQALRTVAQQNALYAEGRNPQGIVINPLAVVTNAIGGSSAHNFGMAVDLYPVLANGGVDWGVPASAAALPAWQALWAAVAANPNLLSGVGFKLAGGGNDPGHVEVKNWELYENIPLPNTVPSVVASLESVLAAPVAPMNPDGSLTYDGQPYDPSDGNNPYNQSPTNPDGSPTYDGLPYDPDDPNNPYTVAGGLPPVTITAQPGGFSLSTPALLALVAIAGIGFLVYREKFT